MENPKTNPYPPLNPQIHTQTHPQQTVIHPTHPQYSHYQSNGQDSYTVSDSVIYGANEYYNSNPIPVQLPETQILVTKCQLLEKKIEGYRWINAIHFVYHVLMIIAYVLLILYIILQMIVNPCVGHGICFDSLGGICIVATVIAALLAIIFTHIYGFKVFYYKKGEKMVIMFWIYIASIILIIIAAMGLYLPLLGVLIFIGILSFLTFTADKLSNIYKDLRKTQARLLP